MSYRPGPVAGRLFVDLLDQPMPRVRCPHLTSDASAQPRLLCSWDSSRISCPTCASNSRARALAGGMLCPGCGGEASYWLTHQQRQAAVILVIGVCHRCFGSDERKRGDDDRYSAARSEGTTQRPITGALANALTAVPRPRKPATPAWSDPK